MRLVYYRGKHPNFGDELNPWLWPRLLPGLFDDDGRDVLVGIGSILGHRVVLRHGPATRKIVMGAAYVPSYHRAPDVSDPSWDFRFVRGPRTARALGLSPGKALGDSAILLREVVDFKTRTPATVSFMPHWESLDRGNWEEACRQAGVTLIDPRHPVDRVVAGILASKVLITEAMHGAIVADALRVPWIAVMPLSPRHRAKWFDWSEALGIDLNPQRGLPSSLRETRLALLHRPLTASPSLSRLSDAIFTHFAAHRLTQLARQVPCLSDDKVMERACEAMMTQVARLGQEELDRHGRGCPSS